MSYPADLSVTAFDTGRRVASGSLGLVLEDLHHYRMLNPEAVISIFDNHSGERLPIAPDISSLQLLFPAPASTIVDDAFPRPEPVPRKPGRPRLGVVAREVTLLPEHWEWLALQEGGASLTLRNLVNQARRTEAARERSRLAHEAAYRYLKTAGEGLPGYDDALRALHAGDPVQFEAQLMGWPEDMRAYACELAFPEEEP